MHHPRILPGWEPSAGASSLEAACKRSPSAQPPKEGIVIGWEPEAGPKASWRPRPSTQSGEGGEEPPREELGTQAIAELTPGPLSQRWKGDLGRQLCR